MKRLLLSILFLLFCNTLFSQNNSVSEYELCIAEKWSMVTNAGFGYDLLFNNVDKTFKLNYISEGTFPISPRINGKFNISKVKKRTIVTLIFNDFTIDYYLKYPSSSDITTANDKLTEKEKTFIESDNKGFPTNYVLIVNERKIINKKANYPHYYDDLQKYHFEYAEKINSENISSSSKYYNTKIRDDDVKTVSPDKTTKRLSIEEQEKYNKLSDDFNKALEEAKKSEGDRDEEK